MFTHVFIIKRFRRLRFNYAIKFSPSYMYIKYSVMHTHMDYELLYTGRASITDQHKSNNVANRVKQCNEMAFCQSQTNV